MEKLKYNQNKGIKGSWVFRGIEKYSDMTFLKLLKERAKETLLEIIKRNNKQASLKYFRLLKGIGFKIKVLYTFQLITV